MNCKPGHLAVIIGGRYPELIGRIIITTVAIYPGLTEHWVTDPPLMMDCPIEGLGFIYPHDKLCRLIDDPQGQDETLTWATVPHEVVTS